MYPWSHKSVKETKSRKNTQIPSFSSTLLDEIYRSMDGDNDKSGQKDSFSKKQSRGTPKASSAVEDEGIASLRRAFLVEKWMDLKVNSKNTNRSRTKSSSLPDVDRKRGPDNDSFFFGSSSSDSSYGWFPEKEDFHKPSCFGPFSRPEPIKTDAFSFSMKKRQQQQMEFFYCPDDHQINEIDRRGLIKSKARVLKIYANLKKIKQPISPGGRLTSFLNSLFANGNNVKKPKDLNIPRYPDNANIERTPKVTPGSTCSSACSFTRSCLSKDSPRSREKRNKNGIRRTVRFYPVSVIIDEDSRPCGEKFISDIREFMKNEDYNGHDDDDDDDDMKSDSSSDLFELDHLLVLKECEELPVYETTHIGTNRAIANGLI